MPGKPQTSIPLMAKLVEEAHGILTLVAQRAQVSRDTVERYCKTYPTCIEAKKRADESILDVAEGKLYKAMNDGEAWAVCFLLKCRGKARGYIERQEVEHSGGFTLQPMAVQYVDGPQDREAKQLTEAGPAGPEPAEVLPPAPARLPSG